MMSGEFKSMSAIHGLLPDFAPKPLAWGTYETVPDTHFFLCEFREMSDDLPDPHKFTSRLAALHENSHSPNGKFGFHITTCAGNLPQYVGWEDSWEVFFAKSMRQAVEFEHAAQGPDPEIDKLAPFLFDKVIPRLLRPLETDGRSLKPSLVHGGLWYANTAVDADTDDSLVFDACCFYAHNECMSTTTWGVNPSLSTPQVLGTLAYIPTLTSDELGQWRPVCNRLGPEYVKAYHSYVQMSPPEEDY